jgi:hypothetical protein
VSLPPSVGTIRIGGTIIHPDTGAPIRNGRVEVTYPYPVYATTDHMTVLPGKVVAKITDGVFLTRPLLDPHDTDITPQGYAYVGRIFSDEWTPDARLLDIPPGSADLTLDWTALGDTTTAPAITTYALVSQLAAYIAKATLTAKGALLVATAAGIVAQLAAGSNGLVLTTDSSTPTGLKWAAGGGGGGGIVTVNGQSGPDVELAAADVGAAPQVHDHVTSDVLGLAAYVDGRASTLIAALVAAAPSTLDTLNELAAALGNDPNFAATITTLLGGKASTATVTTLSGRVDAAETAITGKASTAAVEAVRPRIVRVRDTTLTGTPYYSVPDTAGSWALFNDPGEYSISAAIGDDLEVSYNVLCQFSTIWSLDLVVVTGATPTRQRYLVTGNSTPSFEGNPADYSNGSGASFQGRHGTLGFTVEAGDLDGGLVRLRWAAKSSAATGRLYATANYPLILNIRNSRAPAA